LSLIGVDKPLGDIIGELREAAQETEVIPRGVYLITQFRVIVTYLRLLILPVGQNLDYDYPRYSSLFEPGVLLSFLLLLSVFAFAVYLFIRWRKTDNVYALLASFGILWFFITLSVESSIIPIRDVMFEHRMYLPGVGAVVAFVAGVFYFLEYRKVKNPVVIVFLLLLVAAVPLGAAAYNRNSVWKDEITLWEDIVRKSPEKARVHNNLGTAYSKKGLIDKALQEFKNALRLDPDFARAHYNLGTAHAKQGRTEEAIGEFMVAVRLHPYLKEAHYNLGVAYAKKDMMDEAIVEYKLALGIKPDYIEALNNLGAAYYNQGRMDEAIGLYKKVTTLSPRTKQAHYNLGLAYIKKGLKNEAIREFKEVLKLNPQDEGARKNLQSLSR
jgi:Flp pilus assembly protein TadD